MAIHNGYQGARACTSGPTSGARGLMAWFMAKYADDGGLNAGIYNCRSIVGGSTASLHGEGRAADLAIRPYSADYGWELANLLRLFSAELGIQCVIWDRKIWSGYYDDWRKYTGLNRHVDHLHVELTWKSARLSQDAMVDLLERTIGHLVDDDDVKPVGTTKPKPKPKPAAKTVWQNSKNSKADNIAIAELLNALGYKAGIPDGVPGTYLRDGVKRYQVAQDYFPGMNEDGDWGKMTQDHFEWVQDLQRNLNMWDASTDLGILREDGDYADLTRRHVLKVQKDNWKAYRALGGRVADGIAGPLTCRLLKMKPHPSA